MPDVMTLAAFFTILSTIAGGISLCVAIITLRRQTPKRALGWEVRSSRSVLSKPDELRVRLDASLDNRAIDSLKGVVIRLHNIGQTGIKETDFTEAVSLDFGSEVLDALPIRSDPPDLTLQIRKDGSIVVIEPLLLNAGDYVEFCAFVPETTGDPVVKGRVVDVKRILRIEPRPTRNLRQDAVLVLSACTLMCTTVGMISLDLGAPSMLRDYTLIITFTVTAVLVSVFLYAIARLKIFARQGRPSPY